MDAPLYLFILIISVILIFILIFFNFITMLFVIVNLFLVAFLLVHLVVIIFITVGLFVSKHIIVFNVKKMSTVAQSSPINSPCRLTVETTTTSIIRSSVFNSYWGRP